VTAFAPGLLLGDRFEVVRRLGAGGIAEVFQARDVITGQEVALKALHDHLAQDAALSARFRREMAITRSLDHPSIVRVFDLHEHAGRPFFSMELLRGRTLSSRLEDGALPAPEARRMARAICEALRTAHRAGIVHRDLKPQNVFLCDGGPLKLLDFGMARVAGHARLTAQSMVMGTPGYIAPELLSGTEADARADVYSLGATLFEMLTGRHAFPGGDPYQVLRAQRAGAPEMPGLEAADAELLRRMLEPDPERRFLDADQVLRALGGELVPAPPEPLPSLSAGEFDVIVHHAGVGKLGNLAAVILRLGGSKASRGWRGRLVIDGKNRLAAGVSRDAAGEIAALCAEYGVAATVEPAKSRWRAVEWVARHATKFGILASAGPLGLLAWVMIFFVPSGAIRHWGWNDWSEVLIFAILFFLIPFLPVAGGLSLGAEPPIKDLPSGDPALRRLVTGIGRRVARLRDRYAALPAAQQMLLGDLLREAGATESIAIALAARAPPERLDRPEAETLPYGASRDRTAGRLLEIAAALDDALAVAERPTPDSASATGALSRLREEIEFARMALPDAEK
jgi:tRNA A-37 threonylcarbamoyl transferase component Bud32